MEKLEDCVQRLETVVARFEAVGTAPLVGVASTGGAETAKTSVAAGGRSADAVNAFKEISDTQVLKAVQISNTINSEGLILPDAYRNEIVYVSDLLGKAFQAEVLIVQAMAKCKKPHPAELQKLVNPLVEHLTAAAARTEGKRTDPFNHQKTVAEFLQALTWVALTPEAGKPSHHVDQCWQSAEFYGNKVLKEFRSKDPKHVEWIEAIKAAAMALKAYVTKYHLKEPKWNSDGISVSEYLGTDPPPDLPPVVLPKKEVKPVTPMKPTTHWQPEKPKELPEGDAYTDLKKAFRKVDKSPSPRPLASPKAEFQTTKLKSVASPLKKSRMELEMDRKWNIEFFKGNQDIVVDETSPKHTVYIFQCQDSVIQIKGKVNAITIDACKKVGVVFDTVVSLVEIINSTRADVQCTGRVATITIDKSDECKVYVPETCMDVGITTAKSSSINVIVTKTDPNEDPAEHSVPYQFLSKFKDGVLVTEVSEHTGAA